MHWLPEKKCSNYRSLWNTISTVNKDTSCTATTGISPAFTLIRFAYIFKTDLILHVSNTEMGRDD